LTTDAVPAAVVAQPKPTLSGTEFMKYRGNSGSQAALLGTKYRARHRPQIRSRQIPYIRRFCYLKLHQAPCVFRYSSESRIPTHLGGSRPREAKLCAINSSVIADSRLAPRRTAKRPSVCGVNRTFSRSAYRIAIRFFGTSFGRRQWTKWARACD